PPEHRAILLARAAVLGQTTPDTVEPDDGGRAPPLSPAERAEAAQAIRTLEASLVRLPLDDVAGAVAARQQLGELHARAGDAQSARAHLELVLAEDPHRAAAIEPLADLYA